MNYRTTTLRQMKIPAHLQTLLAGLFALLVFALMAASLSFAQSGGEGGFGNDFSDRFGSQNEAGQGASGGIRYREGTKLVDQIGYFRVQGDQVTFHIDDQEHRFIGLANLNLERVSRAITDEASQLEWSVSGMVTEYRGGNYLLVERAILKTKNTRSSRLD